MRLPLRDGCAWPSRRASAIPPLALSSADLPTPIPPANGERHVSDHERRPRIQTTPPEALGRCGQSWLPVCGRLAWVRACHGHEAGRHAEAERADEGGAVRGGPAPQHHGTVEDEQGRSEGGGKAPAAEAAVDATARLGPRKRARNTV